MAHVLSVLRGEARAKPFSHTVMPRIGPALEDVSFEHCYGEVGLVVWRAYGSKEFCGGRLRG
jgi:hypothetical protein